MREQKTWATTMTIMFAVQKWVLGALECAGGAPVDGSMEQVPELLKIII